MASPYVTGPAHIFCGLQTGGALLYLGTAERWPQVTIRPHYAPLFNDIGGGVPVDMCYDGEEAFTIADISRWNEPVYALLSARPRPSSGLLTPRGADIAGDVGTLMVTEGHAYPVVVQFPYAAKPAYAAAGMPAGYRFPTSYLAGPDTLEPLGTTPSKRRLIWHHLRQYSAVAQAFVLYNHDLSGLPAVD